MAAMSTSSAEHLHLLGRNLSIPEETAINASLQLVAQQYSAGGYSATVRFWGKIAGAEKDYLVSQVTSNVFDKLGHVPFFSASPFTGGASAEFFSESVEFQNPISLYSVDGGAHWVPLPDSLTKDQVEFCDELRGPYIGDPDYQYKKRREVPLEPLPQVKLPPRNSAGGGRNGRGRKGSDQDDHSDGGARDDDDDDGEEDHEEDEIEEQQELNRMDEEDEEALDGDDGSNGDDTYPKTSKKLSKPKMEVVAVSEAVRIAHFVQLHDYACTIVPRGEFLLVNSGRAGFTKEVKRNGAFSGRSAHDASKPSCYLRAHHLQHSLDRNRLLYGPTFNALTDFLSPIADDQPQGVWTVKFDPGNNVVAVRNLLFDGSLFWLKPNTVERGQIYYGNGTRNFELCFMIP